MTMSDEMKDEMLRLSHDYANNFGGQSDYEAGFLLAHNLMAKELEKVRAEKELIGKESLDINGNLLRELTAWKEQAEKLAGALKEAPINFHKSECSVSPKGEECNCHCATIKEALTAFNEFKKEREG